MVVLLTDYFEERTLPLFSKENGQKRRQARSAITFERIMSSATLRPPFGTSSSPAQPYDRSFDFLFYRFFFWKIAIREGRTGTRSSFHLRSYLLSPNSAWKIWQLKRQQKYWSDDGLWWFKARKFTISGMSKTITNKKQLKGKSLKSLLHFSYK